MTPIRWTPRRKAEVIFAIRAGKLTAAAACNQYGLGAEELARLLDLYDRGGLGALRSTRVQRFRPRAPR